jgi:hypothetical protein
MVNKNKLFIFQMASSLGRTIKTVTIIGGGLMGSGIAQASFEIN